MILTDDMGALIRLNKTSLLTIITTRYIRFRPSKCTVAVFRKDADWPSHMDAKHAL